MQKELQIIVKIIIYFEKLKISFYITHITHNFVV